MPIQQTNRQNKERLTKRIRGIVIVALGILTLERSAYRTIGVANPLRLLLMVLPFAVFVSGCATLLYVWHHEAEFRQATAQIITAVRTHLATLLVATATATPGGILAIVAVHALSD